MVKAKLYRQNHTKKHTRTHSQREKKEKKIYIFWEVWGLLPAFSRCSVGVVPHVDVFLMYLWGGRWPPRLTPPPSWRSLSPAFYMPFTCRSTKQNPLCWGLASIDFSLFYSKENSSLLFCFIFLKSIIYYYYYFNWFNLFIFGCIGSPLLHAGFSSCSQWRLFFVAVHGLLIGVSSLVVEHKHRL